MQSGKATVAVANAPTLAAMRSEPASLREAAFACKRSTTLADEPHP
jgi:hypothetical protein